MEKSVENDGKRYFSFIFTLYTCFSTLLLRSKELLFLLYLIAERKERKQLRKHAKMTGEGENLRVFWSKTH